MLEALHEFFYTTRLLWLVVALIGIAYSVVLFVRVMNALSTSQPRQRRSQRFALSRDDEPQTQAMTAPEKAEAQEASGNQQNLLESLPDDGVSSKPQVETETHDESEAAGARGNTYGVDNQARTRFDLNRDDIPAGILDADTPSTPSATEHPPGGMTTVISRGDVGQSGGNDATIKRSTRGASAGTQTTKEMPSLPKQAEAKRREPITNDDLLRRATRMEELGFHVGITPDRLRQDPGKVSDDEKADLIRTLGLLEQEAAERGDSGAGKSDELDDILAKLDNALEEAFGDEQDSDAPLESASQTEPVAQAEQTAQAERARTHDTETGDEQDRLVTQVDSASEPTDATKPADGSDDDDDDEIALAIEDEDEDEEDTPASEKRTQIIGEVSPGRSVAEALKVEASQAQVEDVAEDEDELSPSTETISQADSVDAESQSISMPTEAVSAPPQREERPAAAPSSVPDWARADTFDEDVGKTKKADPGKDDDKPGNQQLDLFS